MGRRPCCDKVGLKRGPWTVEEDHKLVNFILNHGIHCWRTVPKLADLLRCGKSCRLRWINYLRPDLKRGDFTEAEEDRLIELHSCLGNKWSKIASHFPGRTDNEIKNHWNTRTKKRLKQLGLDPMTHKPIPEELNLGSNEEPGCPNQGGSELTSDQTNELFNNNNNNVCSSSSYSSSFSIGESGTLNDQTHDSLQLKQWIESVDSILSWDLFDRLDEDMFFLGKTQ